MLKKLFNRFKTILIVEDEDAIRTALKAFLVHEGYRVAEASNGAAAMDVVRLGRPDLVLLDIMMPVKGGFDFLKELREHAGGKTVPVIILTNLMEFSSLRDEAQKYGVAGYVVKSDASTADIVRMIPKALKGEKI